MQFDEFFESLSLFSMVCLFVTEATFQVTPGSISRLRKGAGSNFEGARSIPYASQPQTVGTATGILQGFSLSICMYLSGVNLRLHTSHSNLQSTCRPKH